MVTVVIVILFVLIVSIRLLYNHVRLNTIPGPVLGGLSNFWRLHAQTSSQTGNFLLQLHEKYGTIVRIGPDLVSVSNPAAIVPIYTGQSRNRLKHDIPYPGTCHSNPTDTICSRSPNAHQYEGVIDPTLRNLVKTFRRHHIIDLTSFLQFFASDFLSRLTSAGPTGANDGCFREPTETGLPGLFAEYPLFKGPVSRLKRHHRFSFVCGGFQSRLSAPHASIPCHTSLGSEDYPSPMQERLDSIVKAFVSTFIFLLKSPTVMRKLRSEIVGAHNRNTILPLPSWNKLSQLKYLQAVMMESLRLSNVQRAREVKAPAGGVYVSGYYVPQGTTIRCHAQVVHNNAQIYGSLPHFFDPDRWLNNDLQQQKCMLQCLVPFQGHAFEHPKVCAVWWELKKAIVIVLMKFDVSIIQPWESSV
ncbi:cytochrome P450 [Aspergillus floccosus]